MTISDIEQRILDKLDIEGSKIDDLCERMVRVETNLTNHLEAQERKFNKTTVLLSVVIGIIALMVAIK